MSRFKLYYFSSKSLRFVEARWFKTKFSVLALVLCTVVLVASFEVNQYFDDYLGLGVQRNKALVAENAILRDQLRVFAGRMEGLRNRLAALSDEGNRLRLLVDLPKLDEDTRKAGFGGTDESIELGITGSVNSMLNELRKNVAKGEQELQLQQTSYREAFTKYEANKAMYPCIPAIKPMLGYYDVNSFGMRLHPVLRVRRAHLGVDYAAPAGTPVAASADGVVRAVGWMGGYGRTVKIRHANGYETLYGHLSRIDVRPGQRVAQGARVGAVGATGIATGPHLDYRMSRNGQFVDPLRLVSPPAEPVPADESPAFAETLRRSAALLGEPARTASR